MFEYQALNFFRILTITCIIVDQNYSEEWSYFILK